jgi:lysyl-tRNA synthetase class I
MVGIFMYNAYNEMKEKISNFFTSVSNITLDYAYSTASNYNNNVQESIGNTSEWMNNFIPSSQSGKLNDNNDNFMRSQTNIHSDFISRQMENQMNLYKNIQNEYESINRKQSKPDKQK